MESIDPPDATALEPVDEVAGFVDPVDRPPRSPGEIVKLVDGPFRVTRTQVTTYGTRYFGVWLDGD